MINIHNIRLSHACNSSSSHSMVFLSDDMVGKVADDTQSDYSNFGWEHFTLASKESKALYLASQLFDSMEKKLGGPIARSVIKDWLGVSFEDGSELGSVDHQSQFSFPYRHGYVDTSNVPAFDDVFFSEFRDFVMQDPVVITGGNDNDDYSHYLLSGRNEEVNVPLPRDAYADKLFSRKDELENFWVLYNAETGSKVRFSFGSVGQNGEMIVNATKSSTPELVDIKITDYCPFGCKFCYQGSTTKGTHAHILTTEHGRESVAKTMAKLGVFEVALGGGEPTLHPDFIEILKAFRKFNITPNFTTRSLAWLKGPNAKEILDLCGKFAFSIDNYNIGDISKVYGALKLFEDNYPPYTNKCTIQIIEQVVTKRNVKEILSKCSEYHLDLTILGFKEDERGGQWAKSLSKYEKEEVDYKWHEIAKIFKESNRSLPRISIDTVLVQRDEKTLNEIGIHSIFMTPEEGKFSMYWDLVGGYIAKSSYGDNERIHIAEDEITSWGSALQNKIKEAYRKW